MDDVIAEVIASDSQVVEAECHRLYEAPAFGSFVRADCVGSGSSQFAVVTQVSTAPFDGSRIVQAHRMAPGELEQRKPHLTTILRTTFRARIVGYGNEGARLAGTPALPARLHCFVYAATPEEIRGLTGSPGFLRPLWETRDVSREDLLVCAIEAARAAWGHDASLVAWGKYLARLLRGDYVTLEGVLQRISPALAVPPPAPHTPHTSPSPHTSSQNPRWEERLPLAGNGARVERDPFEED